jgi:poly-gamma-glutamate capsule biosynthesis protein CapA/YwtB (metallophosphatase superfamily)
MVLALLLALLAAAGPADDALNAGMAAQRADDVPKAIEHYRRCLDLEPDHVRCNWEIGWSYWSSNRWPDVVRHWGRVEQLAPDHPELGRWLPTARANLANWERAKASAAGGPATARPPLPPGRTLRMRFVGDIMIGTTSPHPTDHLPPDDGRDYFAKVAPLLSDADITFGNLEGPLCDTTTVADKCKGDAPCYAFRQPTRYAALIRDAGIDLLSIANNHMMDFGEVCRAQTVQALDGVGIAWSGPPGSIATVEANGFRVAMIAFHTARHSNYINDHDNARALVKQARQDHDLVIVSFHGGAEGSKQTRVPDRMETFYGEQRGHLRKFARDVIDAGAHLVIGHGPHVLRGLEVIDGHLAAYSLGNFATYARFNLSGLMGITAILEVEVDHQGKLVRGRIVPVRQVGSGIPEPDPENLAIGTLRELTGLDFPQTGPTIGADGTYAPKR